MLPLRVILMSRAPIAGQTKTRLIPALGAAGAAEFHAACLNDLLDELDAWRHAAGDTGLSVGLTLSITPAGSESTFRAAGVALPEDAERATQRGDTLDERMREALRDGLADAERVLLIGADLPLLTREHLEQAAQALREHDAVLGPAEDGGYYLIGVRAGKAGVGGWEGLFDAGTGSAVGKGSAVGTRSGAIPPEDPVLERTLARARSLGLRVALIGRLPDVDTPEDAHRVLAHPLAARLSARRSVKLLRERLGG